MSKDLLQEIQVLKRRMRLMMASVLSLAGLLLIGAVAPGSDPQHLTVRSLTVVDEAGVRRAALAAPVPAPTSGGERAGVSAGLIIYGPDGEERGGYITTEGSEGVLTLDDAQGREVFKVVANPQDGASVFLMHQNGAQVAMTTYRGTPELHMRDTDRVRSVAIPADIELLPGWRAKPE